MLRFVPLLLCVVFVSGCATVPPPYVIAVDKLAYASPAESDSLLKEMVPCTLRYEDKWEAGNGDVEGIIGKVSHRTYDLEVGQINMWERKPQVDFEFDDDRDFVGISQVIVQFVQYVPKKEAFRRLGYTCDTLISDPRTPDTWYAFLENVHWVHWEEQDKGRITVVTVDLW